MPDGVRAKPPTFHVLGTALNGPLPLAVRMGTSDAGAAHARLREAGVTLHNEEVLRMEGVPPMFFFSDLDGNGLVYLEESESTEKEA